MRIRDREMVKRELRARVLAGYIPSRTSESCDDHATDFFMISPEEFDVIMRDALTERAKLESKSGDSLRGGGSYRGEKQQCK